VSDLWQIYHIRYEFILPGAFFMLACGCGLSPPAPPELPLAPSGTDCAQAVEDLEEMRTSGEDESFIRQSSTRVFIECGIAALRRRESGPARIWAEQAVRLAPSNETALQLLRNVIRFQIDEAREALDCALVDSLIRDLNISGESPESLSAIVATVNSFCGNYLFEQGDFEEAIPRLRIALLWDPSNERNQSQLLQALAYVRRTAAPSVEPIEALEGSPELPSEAEITETPTPADTATPDRAAVDRSDETEEPEEAEESPSERAAPTPTATGIANPSPTPISEADKIRRTVKELKDKATIPVRQIAEPKPGLGLVVRNNTDFPLEVFLARETAALRMTLRPGETKTARPAPGWYRLVATLKTPSATVVYGSEETYREGNEYTIPFDYVYAK
jgi:tetratricopeptide (TPR) repeat protein